MINYFGKKVCCAPFYFKGFYFLVKETVSTFELFLQQPCRCITGNTKDLTWQFEWQASHEWIMSKSLWSKGKRMKPLMSHF